MLRALGRLATSRLAAAASTPALSSGLLARCRDVPLRHTPSYPAAACPSFLSSVLGGARRPIITVDVYQAPDRSTPGDPASRAAMMAEVARAEDVALSQFNRLVMAEVRRGTLRPGARRNKRFARYTQPALTRRDARRATKWRRHKKNLDTYMNWIQYRRRRTLA